MITSIFPINILVKDFDMQDSWTQDIIGIAKAVFANDQAEKGSESATGNNRVIFFTEENLSTFSAIAELRQMFADSFYELASSYPNNKLTKNILEERIKNNSGYLNFMKKGEHQSVHTHDPEVFAFGIFYLTDIDNHQFGGELVLHNPSFSGAWHFNHGHTYSVPTKKNRMVICPNTIWHEVTPYSGESDRMAIVVNL
jgi:hypothetical protein